jgi:hypothetical protein
MAVRLKIEIVKITAGSDINEVTNYPCIINMYKCALNEDAV